jgi:hypothetical protein
MVDTKELHMHKIFAACIAYALIAALFFGRTFAGVAVRTGREAGFWTEWHYAVVIARVREEAAHVQGAESPYLMHMVIEPLATVAGTFDPSEHASEDVQFYVGTPSIPLSPAEGNIIMIVLRDGNFVVSDECQFMAHDLPLVVIDGIGDARVHDTLKKVREARAHPLP